MTAPMTPELVRQHNISDDEYRTILEILGREPNLVELGIFSAMWSEHCSYKSSRLHLKGFPTTGPRVIQGPGENAGVVDLGRGFAVVFKMESHNHPSFIEPYQGAATGVGGILRDVFTMGARPIASMDPLFFGRPEAPRMRHLVDGVVRGVGGYGNCIGIPTLGGSTWFHEAYDANILVNVFALGIAPVGGVFYGRAAGVGNPILYVGSKTGRDGIHGAKMASESFDDESESKRPTVQVGDPFTEKLLLEACLELFATDACVGIQDMGAAGLTSSTFEMAGRAGTGVRIDLSRVPMRETGMTPYELVLSESQERMVLVAARGREAEVIEIFHKWELDAVVLGEVTDTGRVEMLWNGETVVDLPAAPLADRAPIYDRPRQRPSDLEAKNDARWRRLPDLSPDRLEDELIQLLGSPQLGSRRWIWEQYDHSVRTNTLGVARPGGDAAVIRIKETTVDGKPPIGVAMVCDVNPVWCGLDPHGGAIAAVAEAARNLACVGAEPIGLTDCLNYGSPENPEVMWQFAEGVRGLSDACRALGIPVVSGNVSFYNQTGDKPILPTPSIGVVGRIENAELAIGHRFQVDGDAILLLGPASAQDLGGSTYLRLRHALENGPIPAIYLQAERQLGRLLRGWVERRRLRSAHDVSDGGLLVALFESAFMGGVGFEVTLPAGKRLDAALFGEDTGRAIVSCDPALARDLENEARAVGVEVRSIGTVRQGRADVGLGTHRWTLDLARIEAAWERALPALMARREAS